jgi:hypothetical protein
MSNAEILHAYRHLLRHGLHAVQFSVPARFVIQSQLRRAFRASPRPAREGGREAKDAFDPEAVRRTIWFLKAAAAEKGLEHRIVKNLVRVAWFREREGKENWKTTAQIWEDGGKRYVLETFS